MNKYFLIYLRHLFPIIFILLFGLGGCQKNYYALIMQDGACVPNKAEMTIDCYNSIVRWAPIDVASFPENDPKSQNALKQLVNALHVLLVAPIKLSLNDKMFGLVTLEEAGMHDFIESFLSDSKTNFNEKFTNFVLNAASVIRYGCSPELKTSYYSIDALNFCGSEKSGFPEILVHEARHALAGWHSAKCEAIEADSTISDHFIYECDKSMDEIYGWEIALDWGLLHGTGDTDPRIEHFYAATGIETLARRMIANLSEIKLLPKLLAPDGKFQEQGEYLGLLSEREHLHFPPQVAPVVFQKQLEIALNTPLLALQSGDFNNDGKIDLVLAFPEKFQVYLNQGQGIFTKALAFEKNIFCQEHVTLLPTDFNQDHHLGLAVSCTTAEKEGLFLMVTGRGDGTFLGSAEFERDETEIQIVAHDLNQDLLPDLVIHRHSAQETHILLNKGYGAWTLHPQTWSHTLQWIHISDVDHDLLPDIIFGNNNSIDVSFGLGHGNFTETTHTPYPAGYPQEFEFSPIFGDLNGDNYLDLLYVTSLQKLTIALGNGSSTFDRSSAEIFPVHAGTFYRASALCDVNRDGNLDFVEIADNGEVQVNLARGFLTYHSELLSNVFSPPVRSGERKFILCEDFNGDGLPDLVVGTASKNTDQAEYNRISIFFNQGQTTRIGAQ